MGDDVVRQAFRQAEMSHAGQFRDGGEPYIIHPVQVATHFLAFMDGAVTQHDVAAAVLHDVLEDDTNMTFRRLAAGFGEEVATFVDLLSRKGEGKRKPLKNGAKLTKAEYRAVLVGAPRTVQVIKLCDRLDNLLSLRSCGDARKVGRYLDETPGFYKELGAAARHPELTRLIMESVGRMIEEGLGGADCKNS
jgi:(p)ppGpp synthase/HD superfamily hydrolase